jgi:geranylgeranyl diphosphate synthase type II
VCRAAGGRAEAVLPTAAVLELFHNAFLVHDDVEDVSLSRRSGPTLHRAHGVPIAINVGDAMLALCLPPLLDNTRALGVGRALRVLRLIAEMSHQTVRGQALELGWIRRNSFDLAERDYFRLVHQKTSWYTFVAPAVVGAMIAGATEVATTRLRWWAAQLGLAFQIQDDVLNLTGDEDAVGKESMGDLWEGKRTLMLLHALRAASPSERARALQVLGQPRPSGERQDAHVKTESDVAFLRQLVDSTGAIAVARAESGRRSRAALRRLERLVPELEARGPGDSVHAAFLLGLNHYVVERTR